MRMTHEAIVERALAAEASGFEGIAFMDHLAPPLAPDQDMWEAMTLAGWVLARTTTLVVGHLVLCDSFRHPAVVARQATTLDHASGGRFELGIGSGSLNDEMAIFDSGSTSARVRVERLAESLAIIRGLWSGQVVNHEGEHFTIAGAQQRPVPTRRIPVTIGGAGKRTLGLVREYADWWNLAINTVDKLDTMRDHAGDARVSVQTFVALLPDESSRADVSAAIERRYGGTLMGEKAMVGTAEELRDHFAARHATGIDRFYVWFADFAPVATLERFSTVIAL